MLFFPRYWTSVELYFWICESLILDVITPTATVTATPAWCFHLSVRGISTIQIHTVRYHVYNVGVQIVIISMRRTIKHIGNWFQISGPEHDHRIADFYYDVPYQVHIHIVLIYLVLFTRTT